MDIAWIGHAAFRLRGREAAVVLDPCPSSTGFRLGRPQADIVTISNPAPEHSWDKGVAGEPVRLDAPGEYEIHNVLITGVVTNDHAAAAPDEPPARNVAFVVTIDDVIVAHLGDLRGEPSPRAMEELSRADVLLVPVGGNGRLDAKTAVKVAGAIDPRLVIPMLHKVGPETATLDTVDRFLSAMGLSAAGRGDAEAGGAPAQLDNHINVTRAGLGEHTAVQVLAPRGD
jgi:L-ascorbate metabolism protein UlaG (beta-lactamase superfamily)